MNATQSKHIDLIFAQNQMIYICYNAARSGIKRSNKNWKIEET